MKARKAVATLLLVVFSFYEVVLPLTWQRDKTIIAIVDFKNTSQNTRLNYLEQTIPEAVSTTMARSGRLEIVERSRLEAAMQEMAMSMLGIVDEETAAELGRAVGATTIMVGSFVSISGFVRINARLIDVQTARVLTAESVQGPEAGEGLFNLMDQIAAAMEAQLTGRAAVAVQPQPTPAPPAPQPQPQVQPQPQPQVQPKPEPAPPAVVTQPVVVPRKSSGTGLFLLLLLGAGGAAGYYYYTNVLDAPAEVNITVNIQP